MEQRLDLSQIRFPPDESFVTLSHALSWIAFRRSIDGPQLSLELAFGKKRNPSEAIDDARRDEALAFAMKRLSDLGSGGAIEIRGRYFRDVLDDEEEIFTERILPEALADYQWFDTLDDSLHRGSGLAWDHDHSRRQPLYPRDTRHYRFVTVSRTDLLCEFPHNLVATRSTRPSEANCSAWLLSAFAEDAQNRKAKPIFKSQALDKFHPNLSERGFDRAWAAVAEAHGRNKAGAKRKG